MPAESEGSPSVPQPAGKHKHRQEMFTVSCYDDRFRKQNTPEQTQTPKEDSRDFVLQHVYPCQRASFHPFLISNFFPLTLMSSSASHNDALNSPARPYRKGLQSIRTGINNSTDKRREHTPRQPGSQPWKLLLHQYHQNEKFAPTVTG